MRRAGPLLFSLSMLLVPLGAAAQRSTPAAGQGAPGARPAPATETITIDSRILGRSRQADVALPASHVRTTRRYPVIVVLDGEANFSRATTIVAVLAELGHIPESIVVAIPNGTSNPVDRVHDMTPPGLSVSGSSRNEGGDRFLDFIEKELLPAVAAKHRGGAPAVLIGHSSGGVIATYAAATRPAFPVVVSIDAPVQLEDRWLVKRLLARARERSAKPVRYVSMEARLGWPDNAWSELQAAAPKSWVLRREKLDGETHESMGFLGMYQGLKFAFRDYSIAGAPIPPRAAALAAFDHYRAIQKEFDTKLPPPAPVLRRLVEDLLTEGELEPARQALDWFTESFADQDEKASLEAMIADAAPRLPLKETVADLKAAPRPTPADIEEYLGVWRGKSRLDENTEFELTVRFRVEDGKAVVEHQFPSQDGGSEWRPYEYVKRLPDGIEFGSMNGMRPLGMNVLTGRRTGEVLEGTERFRGILLPLPGGHIPPTLSFRLQRQAR